MFKTIMVLLFGLSLESVGNVLLSKGMKQVGEIKSFSIPDLFGVFLRGITNITVIAGVALDALFFVCMLIALSWTEVSIVMPLTAAGYLTTSLTAKLILNEAIPPMRWVGTAIIVIGCIIVGKSGGH